MASNFGTVAPARLQRVVNETLRDLGRRGVITVRQLISTPVQVVGGVVIRSDPGDPPYMESKTLWRSIKYRVEPKAKTVSDLVIFTDCEYAPALERGRRDGHFEARPFFRPARKLMGNLVREFKEGVAERLREQSNNPFGIRLPARYRE